MKLRDVMSEEVVIIGPDANVIEASKKMLKVDTGFIPVCEGDRILGTITDRDIVLRVLADERDPLRTKVRDVMTKDVIYAFEDQDAADAASIMTEHQVRRIVVLDQDKHIVGVVSLGDLWSRGEHQLSTKAMEGVANTRGNETRH